MSQASGLEAAKKLGLIEKEYNRILEILGREPNFTELSIFSVMWSEHCSYKNSIKWLKTLPRKGDHLLAEAGEENAGLVDIGDGLACAFKIESHNHPSAIEPYQGAATGVGGINRDIFTMGARPIAQLNSLRFGNINLEKTKWLVKGVVKGIGDYGNSFGVPVLGGEVYFDDSFNSNPLVNAMSVGIVEVGKTISAISYGVGNPVFIVGSSTGKDGIHGATFASGDLTEDSMDDLPAVQVGDPFQEKLLLEASLELTDTDAIIGMQDMGAAGITCSSSEMSAKGEHGMDIYLDKVPTRQKDMLPFEILLSESQERMLVVVKKGREQEVLDIFDKWDLNCVEIGKVTQGNTLRYFMNDDLVAQVPAYDLVLGGGAPVYEREYKEPSYYSKLKEFNIDEVDEPSDLIEVAKKIVSLPNVASKNWVTNQYDSMVGTLNMSTNESSDAGIINLKGSDKALAVTVDCNSRYVYADPFIGAMIAVSEAARNITCSGGTPSAITNCLNFGNPYNPEAYWQFVNAVKGMGAACEKFKTPVTGGNVSFYNQTVIKNSEEPVFPTPSIGMLGIIEDKSNITTIGFKKEGDIVILLGDIVNDINSSEYLRNYHKIEKSSVPYFDMEKEYQLQKCLASLIKKGLVNSAHDVADGGLFQCLLEKSLPNKLGIEIICDVKVRKDAFLFGESQGRIVVSCDENHLDSIFDFCEMNNVNVLKLGKVGGDYMVINDLNFGKLNEFNTLYLNGLSEKLQ